jgi:hypothetical protein
MPKTNEAKRAAQQLGSHSYWTAVAFVYIIMVAVGLEWFGRFLVRFKLIEAKGFLDITIKLVVGALALIDVYLILGATIKRKRPLLAV